jgi:hypothetical protein
VNRESHRALDESSHRKGDDALVYAMVADVLDGAGFDVTPAAVIGKTSTIRRTR